MNNGQFRAIWSDEQLAILARMAPEHTARQIATALGGGTTRNAVIGKLRRLGITLGHGKPPPEPSPISAVPTGNLTGKHQRPRSAMKAPTPINPLPQVIAEPVCSHVDFEGLRPHHCRWPVAEDERGTIRLYCGETAKESGPYCAAHHAVSFVARHDWKGSTPHHPARKLFGVGFA